MQYTLMHKNIAVADMELDEATSSIQRIDAVYRRSIFRWLRHQNGTAWIVPR